MPKTGNNIYKRKDGRYEGRILLRRSVYNKPQYIYVYARTLREVKQKMKEVREREQKKQELPAVYMQDAIAKWLNEMKRKWKPNTYDTYLRMINRYIEPILGSYRIEDITKSVLNDFAEELVNHSEHAQMSEGYKKYICAIVYQILSYANEMYQLELQIPSPPDFRIKKKEMALPDEKDLDRLEAYLMSHLENATCLGILLAKYTGIRIGELCALQWKDIDLEKGIVTIRRNLQRVKNHEDREAGEATGSGKTKVCMQMPKTDKSFRDIPLADGLIEILKKYQKAPEQYLIPGRKKEWAEVRTVQYRFTAILKKCQISSFHFHLLRHAFASQCVGQGCDMKSLSEILGHSSVQITMNIYVHSSMKQKKDMMNLICGL